MDPGFQAKLFVAKLSKHRFQAETTFNQSSNGSGEARHYS